MLFRSVSQSRYNHGPSASGKTQLVKDILLGPLKKQFHKVYLICPTKFQKVWQEDIPLHEKRSFDTADDATFEYVMDEIMKNNENNEKSLIIIDDCVGTQLMKINSSLSKYYLRLRHYNASILVLTQLYKAVPRMLRVNCDKLIVFKMANKREEISINEENGNFSDHYEKVSLPYESLHIDFTKNITDPQRFSTIPPNRTPQHLNALFT